jgi:Domain of unknown function (DUF4258)
MTITYTQHALARMAERGIGQQEVEATLKYPIRLIPAEHGRTWPNTAEFIRKVSLKDLATNIYFEL